MAEESGIGSFEDADVVDESGQTTPEVEEVSLDDVVAKAEKDLETFRKVGDSTDPDYDPDYQPP